MAIGILGTGSYLPKLEVTNADIADRFGVTPEWIERKTRILSRRYVAPDEAASDLAVAASDNALAQAGLTAADLDYIVVSTTTGDHPLPPTACLVQNAIDAHRAACFDINIACSGFVYALAVARGLLATGPGRHALVIATDVYSRFIDNDDRSTAVLLGDGAGAVVVGDVPGSSGILDVDLRGHGDAYRLLVIEAGGSREPASVSTVEEKAHFLRMRGREVTEFVHGCVPDAIGALLDRAGVPVADVAHFVPHQANGVLLESLVEMAGLGGARTHLTLDRYGNLGSASIPVTLDEAVRSGAVADGDLVLLCGFGGGMATGTCLLRWGSPQGA